MSHFRDIDSKYGGAETQAASYFHVKEIIFLVERRKAGRSENMAHKSLL